MSYGRALTACLVAMVLLIGVALLPGSRSPRLSITEENGRMLWERMERAERRVVQDGEGRKARLEVKGGMLRAEVEAVLGGPQGDYGRRGRTYHTCACQGWVCSVFYNFKHDKREPTVEEIDALASREGIAIWWGPDIAIAVQFDGNGQALALGYGRPDWKPGLLDRARGWLGW